MQAGPERNNARDGAVLILVDGGGDAPIALAQDFLDAWQQIKIRLQALVSPVFFDLCLQPVHVAERLVHVRLFDFDIAQMHRRMPFDIAVTDGFADDLRIDDRVLRHVDDEVALNGGGAGKAAVRRDLAHLGIAQLFGAAHGNMIVGRDNLVLGKIAFLHLNLTAPARRPPAADALDIDAQLPRGVEHGCAHRKAAAFAGGHEEDEGIGGGHVDSLREDWSQAPLSVLSDISPARGETARRAAFANLHLQF